MNGKRIKLTAAEYKKYKFATSDDLKSGVALYQFKADGTPGGGLYPVSIVDSTKKVYIKAATS